MKINLKEQAYLSLDEEVMKNLYLRNKKLKKKFKEK